MMKKKFLYILFSACVILIFSSCLDMILLINLLVEDADDDFLFYQLEMEFIDAETGKYLTEGIRLNSDKDVSVDSTDFYRLDVVAYNTNDEGNRMSYSTDDTTDNQSHPVLHAEVGNMNSSSSIYLLFHSIDSKHADLPLWNCRLSCPYIYGDEEPHEFVIQWENQESCYPNCSGFESDDPRILSYHLNKADNSIIIILRSSTQ